MVSDFKGSVAASQSPLCTQSPLTPCAGGAVKAWDYGKPASDLEVGLWDQCKVEHLAAVL